MLVTSLLFVLGISLVLSISLGHAAPAQTPDVDNIASAFNTRSEHIDEFANRLNSGTVSDAYLANSLRRLIAYQGNFNTYAGQLKVAFAVPADQLEKLGPPPADGQPPESPDIARVRKQLTDQVSRLNGLSKRIDLASDTVSRLIGQTRTLQRNRNSSRIRTRSALPFSAQLWTEAGAEIAPAVDRFTGHIVDQWNIERSSATLAADISLLVAALGVAIGLLTLPRLPRLRQFKPPLLNSPVPSAVEKKRYAAFHTLGYGLLAAGASLLLFGATVETGMLAEGYSDFALRSCLGSMVLVAAWNYLTCVFSPHRAQWRRVPVDSRQAARLRSLLMAGFALFVFDRIIFTAIELTNAGSELATVQLTLTNSLFAVLLWLSSSPRLWHSTPVSRQRESADPGTVASTKLPKAGPGGDHNDSHNDGQSGGQSGEPVASASPPAARWQDAVLVVSRMVAAGILLLTWLGYTGMANFLFHRIVLLVLLLMLAGSTRTIARWGLSLLKVKGRQSAPTTSPQGDADDEPGFWQGLTLDLTWFALCIPAFLLIVGFDWIDISRWLDLLKSDIHIGQFSVSFVNILTALFALLLAHVGTQRMTVLLDVQLMQHAHLGPDIRATITTLAGYISMLVASLVALGIVGIGWTQLALVAGALSVGIGFGLQSIVKNFISGLILLFERPIKVGDWVVVASGQGYVRNIGARATEIETFDRSSIIIPNAELITSAVENWFYKNRRGRISIQVGVSYDSDPEQVRDILLDCAAQQSNILHYPYKPRVRWLQFGDSSLDFELIAFIKDIDVGATARSDLHFTIFKALKHAGIEIPFPQRDLHIKSDNNPGTT